MLPCDSLKLCPPAWPAGNARVAPAPDAGVLLPVEARELFLSLHPKHNEDLLHLDVKYSLLRVYVYI